MSDRHDPLEHVRRLRDSHLYAQHVATATRSENRRALAHPVWQLQLRDAHSRRTFTSLALGLQPEDFRNLLFIEPSDHDPTNVQRPPSDIEDDDDDDDAPQADEDCDNENSTPNTSAPRAAYNPDALLRRSTAMHPPTYALLCAKYLKAHRPQQEKQPADMLHLPQLQSPTCLPVLPADKAIMAGGTAEVGPDGQVL